MRLLKAIFTLEITTPTSSASSGDGGRRIGAGLSLDENRPRFNRVYVEPQPSMSKLLF